VVLCLNKETKDRVYVKDGVADIFMLDNDNKEVSRREHINHAGELAATVLACGWA
jgi:hypothetical protein